MALDLFDLVGSWLDVLLVRRIFIPLVVGIAAGAAFYYISGQDPSSAAVAFGIGIAGLLVGVVWHIAGGNKPGSA